MLLPNRWQSEWPRWSDKRFPDELGMLANSFQTTTLGLRDKVIREEKLRALFQHAAIDQQLVESSVDLVLAGITT